MNNKGITAALVLCAFLVGCGMIWFNDIMPKSDDAYSDSIAVDTMRRQRLLNATTGGNRNAPTAALDTSVAVGGGSNADEQDDTEVRVTTQLNEPYSAFAHPEVLAVSRRPQLSNTTQWWAGQPPSHFLTTYKKTHCGATVSNMCLRNGQPVYQTHEGNLFTRSGATTVCNEAIRKSKLHMIVKSATFSGGISPATTTLPVVPYQYLGSKSVLLVPFCWELYGYHLLLCLMSTWVNLQRVQRESGLDTTSPDTVVSIGFMKGAGAFPYLRGSNHSWTDLTPPAVSWNGEPPVSKAVATPYWPLWRILASDPNLVAPLSDLPPTCYSTAVLGHLPSYDVSPAEQQAFRSAAIRRLLRGPVADAPRATKFRAACKSPQSDLLALNIVVVQRHNRYRIENVKEVVSALRVGFGTSATKVPVVPWSKVNVELVYLENMTVLKQLHLATTTDVLVGVHGNGLSWSMFQESGAALLELWPRGPYNTNYPTFAQRGNLFYESVNGNGKCLARCSAAFSPALIEAAALKIASHFYRTRCLKETFNTTAAFFAVKEAAAKRKRERHA